LSQNQAHLQQSLIDVRTSIYRLNDVYLEKVSNLIEK